MSPIVPLVLASPLLDQPFIVGPRFSPVPAKVVAQFVAGKYINLSDLLAVNLVQREPEPQLLLDGRLVKRRRAHGKLDHSRAKLCFYYVLNFTTLMAIVTIITFSHRLQNK